MSPEYPTTLALCLKATKDVVGRRLERVFSASADESGGEPMLSSRLPVKISYDEIASNVVNFRQIRPGKAQETFEFVLTSGLRRPAQRRQLQPKPHSKSRLNSRPMPLIGSTAGPKRPASAANFGHVRPGEAAKSVSGGTDKVR